QVILYSAQDLAAYRALRARGALGEARLALLFVLGRYAEGRRSTPADLLPFLFEPVAETWSVCAFGPAERDCVTLAALLGGHARIGFENNLLMADGSLAPDNAALVRQFVETLRVLGRRPASAAELRAL
ncbi:3-keto-5-aminohexanoate cleavage protein, partial [Hansschlegelia zhihuaiae]